MDKNRIEDYPLTIEEIEKLPEPLRAQREAHVEFINEFKTEHPIEDGGESTEAFSHMLVMRAIMDEVTRRVLNNDK